MILEAGCGSALSLPNIPAWAWCGIGTSAGYVVDHAGQLLLGKLVFGFHESFSEGSMGRDGSSKPFAFEDAGERLRDAGEIG